MVDCMSSMSATAACSTSSVVGRGGSRVGMDWALKVLIQLSFRSGSMRTPWAMSAGSLVVALRGWPFTCSRAWSNPRLPSQLTRSPVKVLAWIAALLNQARSIVESHSCSMPLRVTSPGLLASMNRLVAAHSSIWSARLDFRMSRGDHVGEWVLKSPTTSVGIVASMSSVMSTWRLVGSCMSW